LHSLDSNLPVIVMTAWGSVELAVEAMRRGARDFIQKPWDNARVAAILKTQIELGRALRMGQRLEAENRALRAERFPRLVAQSAAMRPVLDVISRVGPSDANVLITGENGTGKGLVAHTLHSASLRAARPLVTVNTGGLAEGLFESELFGHVKGAFTDAKSDRIGRFEMADNGTLFLDEIANLPPNLQAKLLRALETGSSSAWDRQNRSGWTCASSPQRMLTWPSRWPQAVSARTCCSGLIRLRSACRRCAKGAKIFRCWRLISYASMRPAIGNTSPNLRKAQ